MTPKDVAKEVAEDVKFDRLTMIQKRLDCLPILVKWQSRKYQLKQEILDYEDSSNSLFEGIINAVMADSEINLTKMAASNMANTHPDWVKFKKHSLQRKFYWNQSRMPSQR